MKTRFRNWFTAQQAVNFELFGKASKYKPHQGKRECERRMRQLVKHMYQL
jgi:hypothetical protein